MKKRGCPASELAIGVESRKSRNKAQIGIMDHITLTLPRHSTLKTGSVMRPRRDIGQGKGTGPIPTTEGTTEVPISLQAGWSCDRGRAHLVWKNKPTAKTYRVEYAPMTEAPNKWKNIGLTTATCVELQGLSPRTEYWFRIVAIL